MCCPFPGALQESRIYMLLQGNLTAAECPVYRASLLYMYAWPVTAPAGRPYRSQELSLFLPHP